MRRTWRGLALVAVFLISTISAGAAALTSSSALSPPPVVAVPRASCGPGSRPETGIQGRVSSADYSSGRAAQGFTCNTELVGSYKVASGIGTYGGFKVLRYVDAAGHECGYYDTTLLFPTNIFNGTSGVNVLDMHDPTHPVLTDTLVTAAMLSPHESLVVSEKRGLLVAVLGNPGAHPGAVDVYDLSADCRHPVLRATTPIGIFGHESGMAPDGLTFYSSSPGTFTLVPIDLTNPSIPLPLALPGIFDSHGLSISNDGNRAYAAGIADGLIVLDTSQVQSRVVNPTMPVVGRLKWTPFSIPQNAIPVTIHGHPYLVEFDEYGAQSSVGAGRIIDIGDETKPFVVSNIRLEVHQPENFAAQAGDPGASNTSIQGYAAHYCNVPQRADPGIVACSMILSGLRVFDIRDPFHPREIAYYNAPAVPANLISGNYAMSSPSFAPERHEIWYSEGRSGFYAVRLTNGAWPTTSATTTPAAAAPVAASSLPNSGRGLPMVLLIALGAGIGLVLLALRFARRAT
ncbi:MAG: hypothetical protein M3O87_01390 [Candidatus Dormibacteraeota bacterium]|nr:hypothetical protein [Candidatus Dormibacteraeota bacterium]